MHTMKPLPETLSVSNDGILYRQVNSLIFGGRVFAGIVRDVDHAVLVLTAEGPTYVDFKGLGFMFPKGLLPWLKEYGIKSIIGKDAREKAVYEYHFNGEPLTGIKYKNKYYMFIPLSEFTKGAM